MSASFITPGSTRSVPAPMFLTNSLMQAPKRLDDLPVELQCMVLGALPDEDSRARLGATSRHWHDLAAPYVYPPGLDALEAVQSSRRHALARALGAPRGAAHYLTHARDADKMTPLMHAARTGDAAMLRCVLRHAGPPIDQRDRAELSALDWAVLGGNTAMFVEAVHQTLGDQAANMHHRWHVDLHDAVNTGHRHLASALLQGPSRERGHDNERIHFARAYADLPLRCDLQPLVCAIAHANGATSVVDAVRDAAHITQLSQAQKHVLTTTLQVESPAWAGTLRAAVGLGFDPFDAPRAGESYFARWLVRHPLTPAAIDIFSNVLGTDILAPQAHSRMLFETCLTDIGRFYRSKEIEGLLEAIILRGFLPDPDIDTTARRIADASLLSPSVWTALKSHGARIDAVDDAGRTLAHHTRNEKFSHAVWRSYMQLAAEGLDVQQLCRAGHNPVMDFVMTQDRNEDAMQALLASGFDVSRPGHVTVGTASYEADSMLEAVLFKNNKKRAVWFIKNDLGCSLKQMRQARKNLRASGVVWPRRWFDSMIAARALGLSGTYSAHHNPAGAWHAQLSRTQLTQAISTHRDHTPGNDASASRRFRHTVQASALNGALVARHAATPLTRCADAVLGTQREFEQHSVHTPMRRFIGMCGKTNADGRAGGIVSHSLGAACVIGAYGMALATAPVTYPISYVLHKTCTGLDDNEALFGPIIWHLHAAMYGIDYPIMTPIAQSAAILGCVPKALVSAIGFAGGAAVGVARGAGAFTVNQYKAAMHARQAGD